MNNNANVTVVDHPLLQHKLTLMRDKNTSSASFRRLLKEISILLTYEVLRDMPLISKEIETPLQVIKAPILEGKKLAFISILRAGNGLLDGMLELVPSARVGHIGLYRDHDTLEPVEYYYKVPKNLDKRLVVVVDPMLATSNSATFAIDKLKKSGAKKILFVSLLCAPEGIEVLTKAHPDIQIFTASIDEKLNELGYIIPGLGDAGDRIYGTK